MIDLVKLSGRTKTTLVQKILDIDKAKPEKLKWPMLFSEKIDGVYCLALKYDDTVTIYSRTGEVYTSMKHIESQLNEVMCNDDIVIFEAFAYCVPQSVISGCCRDTKNQHAQLRAMCHQYLTVSEFINGGTTTALESYVRLQDMVIGYEIKVIHQQLCPSLEAAMQWTKEIWANGGEGSVLCNPNGVFMGGKRNAEKVRIKQGESHDLMVTGIFEGTGKYTGMLGGIFCRFRDGMELRVGSGFSDSERREFFDRPELIIGLIAQIDAMRGSSKGKLREPRYKGKRWDTEADF